MNEWMICESAPILLSICILLWIVVFKTMAFLPAFFLLLLLLLLLFFLVAYRGPLRRRLSAPAPGTTLSWSDEDVSPSE